MRAFEAAARHESFVKAAQELCVSAGAVAQQVKVIEQWANTKLFERLPQGVVLTPIGQAMRDDFIDVFDQLGFVVQKLRSISSPQKIQIACLPSIAQYWLSPALSKLRQYFPDTEISVYATDTPPNLLREPFDICLYFEENPDQTETYVLAQDIIYPVCSPEMLTSIRDVNQQHKITLFHDSRWNKDWEQWLSENPGLRLNASRGPEFSLYSLAVEETKNGAGALIGHELLVAPLIRAGELVKPFPCELKLDRWLTMRVSPSSVTNPAVNELAQYLKNGSSE